MSLACEMSIVTFEHSEAEHSENMAKNKRTTVKQVAEHAGVSPMTVSNYVNRRFDLMSDKMRERVGKSVSELNYRRNFGAHSLRTSQAWSIGIVVVDRSDHYLSDGYTTQIISGFSNRLNQKGYSVLLQGITPEDFHSSNFLQNLRTDAIAVLLSGSDKDRLAQFEIIQQLDQPTLVFLEIPGTGKPTVCTVKQDETAGARALAEKVLENAKQHVVILTSGLNEWAAVNDRVEGMLATLKNAGVDHVCVLKCGDCGVEDVQRVLKNYVAASGLPEAVMCINDTMALAVLDYFKQSSFSVPEDVRVTGYNAFGLHLLSWPRLTTVRSPAYKMGEIGADELLHCLDHGTFTQTTITCPIELIEGASA